MRNDHRLAIRAAFHMPARRFVRVAADHFLVDGEPTSALIGRLVRTQLLRKLFERRTLVCESPDAIQARDGTLCDECRHPRCRPHLRVILDRGALHLVLDLGPASARNLLALEDELVAEGLRLEDCPLRLSVVAHGSWGEVRFDRFPDP